MDRLSAREKKILQFLIDGHSTADIARDLQVSAAMVKTAIREIIRKLTAKSGEDGA
jgi:DNA-binding CsgD family transcriptional regulator